MWKQLIAQSGEYERFVPELHFVHKGFCKALIVGWSIGITEQLEVTDCGIESGPFAAY